MRLVLAVVIAALTLPAFAQEVPLPRVRPEPAAEAAVPLPRVRPEEKAEPEPAEKKEPEAPGPPRVYQTACPAALSGQVEAKALPPIAENQCAVQSPLSVTGVFANGRMIPLSGEAVLGCGMATALPAWAAAVDAYVLARENTRIEAIIVGTSYMCRPRNHVEDADLSEHGFANALDVVGFRLADGRTVTPVEGWADALSPEGRLLRFAHDAGCASFTTTLGPEANALHADHLHFDLGCHGTACTARLCE